MTEQHARVQDRAAVKQQTARGTRPASPAAMAATALLYFCAAKLGLSMASVAAQVTAVWPPTGIALAAVVLLGPRVWPGIAVGAFLTNATAHEPLWTAAGIAAGNTLEALVGAWLLRRARFQPSLDRLRDVLALVVLAAAGSPVLSATIGVTTLCLGGVQPWSASGALWWVWWVGDAMGDLIMAPLLLAWAHQPPLRVGRRRGAEAAALLGCVVGTSLAIFTARPGAPLTGYPMPYLIFPFVIWAAFRFGQRGTTTVTFCAAAVAIGSTVAGWGPFAAGTAGESLVSLQLFMGVVAVTALLLSAAITERNVAERHRAADFAQLRMSEERLRLALDAGRMGIWDWDIETGQLRWSSNLEPIHGLPPGRSPRTLEEFQPLIHPEDRDLVNREIASALAGSSPYDVEFRNVWPDGSVHWIAGIGTVFRDAQGRPLRMLGVGIDVDQRRGLEEALKRQARELLDADRRKDEFLAMLAHELRNPLAPLSNALHLMGIGTSDRERLLHMAERQVSHLTRLVDDLLDVSRITQGKVTLRREVVALADVVARALEMVRPLLDEHRHALTVSLPAERVRVDADPARLAQVVANLLTNAAKYTSPGGSIWLTAEYLDDEVAIRVRDSGAGIPADVLPRVFDLFFQGDASIDRTGGGLGIGLTVVRRLVELHGGRVEARSPGTGLGSEFLVRLPAMPAVFVVADDVPERRARASEASPLKILLVEDNLDAAESLEAVLQLWGHDVRVAFDGAEALEAAEEHEPDVIFSDLGLPGMDGYVLARRLRERPAFGHVVLVALSGYGRDEDRRRALDAGFDHHLVKPPDLVALQALLGRLAPRGGESRPRTFH